MSALITCDRVSKSYPLSQGVMTGLRGLMDNLRGRTQTHDVFHAVDDISLTVEHGSSLGIIGDNGAGKSTLLKLISGVLKPTTGHLEVNGRISALLELGSGFHPEYTGYENIDLAAALLGLQQSEVAANMQKIIDFADIGDYINQPIKHYSSGMIMRLGFAIATTLKPDLLISDEILAVGDESFQKKCITWIENYLGEGGTLLLCAHNTFHIQTLCQQCVWIKKGRIHRYGDSFEVTQDYLAYHEEKRAKLSEQAVASGTYRVKDLFLSHHENSIDSLSMNDELTIKCILYSPDDRPPSVLIGIIRIDGTAVFGTNSNDANWQPKRIEVNHFAVTITFPTLTLLPGKYRIRAHAMDPEGLRVFDTLERSLRVTGKTRDLGLCYIPHQWST